MLLKFYATLLLFFLDKANLPDENKIPYTVSGVVNDRATGKPIRHVHVYTRKGEEEAVTDEKGAFRFQTWQRVASLSTERTGYQPATIQLNLPAAKQVILLLKR